MSPPMFLFFFNSIPFFDGGKQCDLNNYNCHRKHFGPANPSPTRTASDLEFEPQVKKRNKTLKYLAKMTLASLNALPYILFSFG